MRYAVILVAVFVISLGLLVSTGDAQITEGMTHNEHLMASPAAMLVGTWEGTSTTMTPQGEMVVEVRERARWHLSGESIVVEGLGFTIDEETGEALIGHNAFALIAYDEITGEVMFNARREGEGFVESKVTPVEGTDNAFTWGFSPMEGAQVRFTITMTETTWHEIGEFSRGETGWMKFLEMNLERVE